MAEEFMRSQLLFGEEAMHTLRRRGGSLWVGGVGGYVVEALVRSGVGTLDIIDHDTVSITNINRQIVATHKTIGQYKVDILEKTAILIGVVHVLFYLRDHRSI